MKKYPFILVSLLVVAAAAALFLARDAQLQANQANTNDSQVAAEIPNEVSPPAHEDYMHAAETVDVKTEGATGDVVVAGANVKIDGEVQGYVMAAGANVSINAPVGNDLFAAGANVDVNAPIADNAMLAGSAVSIQKDATIGGNARIVGSSVDVMGRVMRNLKVAAANARVSSDVGGNADVRAERVVIDPGAVIHGRLTVYSPNEPVVSPEAQVFGGVDYHRSETNRSPGIRGWLIGWFIRFVWLSVLGLALVWLSSVWLNRVSETIKRDTGRSFLTGLIAVVAAPILCILLFVTVVGLPLGVILGGITIVALMLAGVFVSYFLGSWATSQLNRWQDSSVGKVLIGSLIVSFVIMLPWVGWLAKLVIVFFGVGAFLIERRDLFKTMRAQGLA